MFSFLSPDSKFMQVVSRFTDLVILNVLYLLTCLPIFTIGAATAAMYTLCFRMVRNREEGLFRSCFRSFRDNFKQGTLVWLLLLFIGVPAFFYFDTFFAMEGGVRYLFVVFFSVLVLTLFVGSYSFPLISQFANTTRAMLRNSLLLSLTHLPQTLAVTVINLLPWALLFVNWNLFMQVSFLLLTLYFSAAAYMNAAILWKVFKPYYPEETPQM